MYNDDKKDTVYNGVPTTQAPNQPSDVPPGHSRFYCEKCQSVRFEMKRSIDNILWMMCV